MNARPNPYALTFSGIAGTAIASIKGTSAQSETRKLLQAMADAPLTGPRFPSAPSAEVMEGRRMLRDRLDAELAQDEPNGWNDASEQYEEMPE